MIESQFILYLVNKRFYN